MQVLHGIKGIAKVEFNKKDIVRHKLVQRIVGRRRRGKSNNDKYNICIR